MRTKKIKVLFGAMGNGKWNGKNDSKKQGFEIVGICERNPLFPGKNYQN